MSPDSRQGGSSTLPHRFVGMMDESSMEGLVPTGAVRAEINCPAFSSIRCIATANSSMSSLFFFSEVGKSADCFQVFFRKSALTHYSDCNIDPNKALSRCVECVTLVQMTGSLIIPVDTLFSSFLSSSYIDHINHLPRNDT